MLRDRGSEVRCLVRRTSSVDRIADLGCEQVTGDLLDPISLKTATQDCEACIHLAGIENWNLIHSTQMRDVVFVGSSNLLKAAIKSRVRRFVYVSSTVAVGGSRRPQVHNEESPHCLSNAGYAYAVAKRETELLCRQYRD